MVQNLPCLLIIIYGEGGIRCLLIITYNITIRLHNTSWRSSLICMVIMIIVFHSISSWWWTDDHFPYHAIHTNTQNIMCVYFVLVRASSSKLNFVCLRKMRIILMCLLCHYLTNLPPILLWSKIVILIRTSFILKNWLSVVVVVVVAVSSFLTDWVSGWDHAYCGMCIQCSVFSWVYDARQSSRYSQGWIS